MLGKLFKHEFVASSHYYLPVYLASAIVSVLLAVIWGIDMMWKNNLFSTLTVPFVILLFIGVLVAISASCFFINFFRFYKTMVSDEGYLTHTLPVTVDQLILSRLFVAAIYNVLSFLLTAAIVFGAVFLTLFASGEYLKVNWADVQKGFDDAFSVLGFNGISGTLYVFEMILVIVAQLFTTLLVSYLAMAIAQCMKNHKVLWTIVWYVGVNIGYGMITNVITTVLLITTGYTTSNFEGASVAATIQVSMVLGLLLSVALGVVCYIVTRVIFKNRLNLE